MPAVPRRASAGIVSTFVADAVTIVMSAVIPARSADGAPVSVTVTGYETTLPDPLLSPAVGAIAETVPWIVASIASTVIGGVLPDRSSS